MMWRARFASVAVVALLAAACGSDDASLAALDGEYIATALVENGVARALVDDTTIRLRLDGGELTAHAGCNTIGGSASIEDSRLVVDAVSMTEMGCGAALHAQDEWLAEVLTARPILDRVDDGFDLRSGSTVITFVDRAIVEPDAALIGTTWMLDGYVAGVGPDAAVSSASTNAVLVLEENGYVTGHDGCNEVGYAGEMGQPPTDGLRYDVTGDRITFTGSAVTTDMACPDVETDRYWEVLSGSVVWEIDASRLTLRADDGRGVTFQAHRR